jgi:hypothetical protein
VYEIQLRNMQYKLMERPELKLGYLTKILIIGVARF